ncbi:MAG: hypothetical protein DMG62_11665 [Acidobacteria bacterium]|nr:MAG: hypothetical protein DMG62_11665 [Acidobacteriota bacterium]
MSPKFAWGNAEALLMSAKRSRSKSSSLRKAQRKALSAEARESRQDRRKHLPNRMVQCSKAPLGELTAIDWNDLLGREHFQIDLNSVRHIFAGKIVLVTGAAGSIGSELCRQILECQPAKLVCIDHSETGLFYLQTQLRENYRDAAIVYCVEDFTHSDPVKNIFDIHRAQIVFHAAGYKHVPIMEENPRAALENNVFGLIRFLDICEAASCEAFVLISSDKAVNPTSVMGCTKRLGELILAVDRGMRCLSVRFGNVFGSHGSVVPLFLKQIEENKPLTVTDSEATRLFITVGEAVSLLLQAAAIGKCGEILVLEMGEPIRIGDLADTLLRRFGGLQTLRHPGIKLTGLRPGEKLHEELFYEYEQVLSTSCDRIKRLSGIVPSWPELKSQLETLQALLYTVNDDRLRAQIQRIIPEYCYMPAVTSEVHFGRVASLPPKDYQSSSPRTAFPSSAGQTVAIDAGFLQS